MTITQQGSLLYISTTIENSDLNAAAFAALSWTLISQVGSVGETGTSDNILSYDTQDTTVTQKAKGIANAGDPEIEVARVPTDAGQIALRAAALVTDSYAFKRVMNDSLAVSATTIYMRGIVGGPKRPNGRNEDFDLEVFQLGLNQKEVVVDPSAV